jgi:acetyl esterase/lipase
VPVGYAWTVAVTILGVACALTSWRRFGTATFLPAMLASELPFLLGYSLVAATALAFAEGDLDSPPGVAAAVVALLSLAGLLVVVRRALRARPAVWQALDEGLGGGWRDLVSPRRRPWAKILRAPLFTGGGGVDRIRDIAYGEHPRRNRLDVYRRRDRPVGGPVLLHLHGGAFRSGHKGREARPLIYHLARRGWVCVSANYRLRPSATPADQAADTARAIAWVRAHAADYGGDPTSLFLTGSSAGAYLCAQAVFGGERDIAGVICRYGYYGALVPAGDIPAFLVVHGENDVLVPAADARRFADRVRAMSASSVVYAELPGGHHVFDIFQSIRGAAVVDAVDAFAAWARRRGAEPLPDGRTP